MNMPSNFDILVTLSTFGKHSDEPRILLDQSGFTYKINSIGQRMTPEEILKLGKNCKGLVAGVETYSAETLEKLTNLRCISRCGSGIDSIDLEAAKEKGVVVLNTPDEPTIAVAELTIAMMLALLRQIPKVNLLMHQKRWQRVTGNLLAGKTIGIIGLGRIGRRVAEIVQVFGTNVIGVDPKPDDNWIDSNDVEIVSLDELLSRTDIVSIHAAASKDHQFRLGTSEFKIMKQGAWILNLSRGDMLDDAALNEALNSGKISGAALDVYPHEPYSGVLCDNNRVILSPHQATLTVETRVAMEARAVNNLLNYLNIKR